MVAFSKECSKQNSKGPCFPVSFNRSFYFGTESAHGQARLFKKGIHVMALQAQMKLLRVRKEFLISFFCMLVISIASFSINCVQQYGLDVTQYLSADKLFIGRAYSNDFFTFLQFLLPLLFCPTICRFVYNGSAALHITGDSIARFCKTVLFQQAFLCGALDRNGCLPAIFAQFSAGFDSISNDKHELQSFFLICGSVSILYFLYEGNFISRFVRRSSLSL